MPTAAITRKVRAKIRGFHAAIAGSSLFVWCWDFGLSITTGISTVAPQIPPSTD